MDESKVILAPDVAGQKLSVFKLHKDDDISWPETKMKRENEFQPWQIKLGSGRTSRRFKAVKEGGVGENASYFIFYKPKNSTCNTYEVCPIEDWYNVSATQRYKTLTAEEAEQKFEQRHKTLNYFSIMHMKKNDDEGDEKLSFGGPKAFKITEMDDWNNSDDDFSGSGGEGERESGKKEHKSKAIKKEDSLQEGKEDSDEGDFEQREVDYMSDTSSEKSETDVKGIAEEEALRELLSTDEEEEEVEGSPSKKTKSPLNQTSIITSDIQQDADGDESESSDSDDYDVDEDKMDSMFSKKSLPAQLVKRETPANPSATPTSAPVAQKQPTVTVKPTTAKRKPESSQPSTSSVAEPATSSPKRHCPAEYSNATNSHEKVVEDLIKKYLSRKPMTLRALLKDIKNKLKRMGNSTSEMDSNLVNTIATIINRIKPERQKINDTIYLSLKA